MDVEQPRPSPCNRLSVDRSKGRLVVERMDSIRNLFGCELRVIDDDRCGDDGGGDKTTFAVSRLDEYRPPDDRLIERLKVSVCRLGFCLRSRVLDSWPEYKFGARFGCLIPYNFIARLFSAKTPEGTNFSKLFYIKSCIATARSLSQ